MAIISPITRARLRKAICLNVQGINKVLDALDTADTEIADLTTRLEEAEKGRDWLAGILPECPDQHFDENFRNADGTPPAWCSCMHDRNGEPIGCYVTDVSKCWLNAAREAAKESDNDRN